MRDNRPIVAAARAEAGAVSDCAAAVGVSVRTLQMWARIEGYPGHRAAPEAIREWAIANGKRVPTAGGEGALKEQLLAVQIQKQELATTKGRQRVVDAARDMLLGDVLAVLTGLRESMGGWGLTPAQSVRVREDVDAALAKLEAIGNEPNAE